MIKAFEILYRIFNANWSLFEESLRVQLNTVKDSVSFSHYIDAKLPHIRRLGKGYVEDGHDAEFELFMLCLLQQLIVAQGVHLGSRRV